MLTPIWRNHLLPDIFCDKIMRKCRSFCACLMFIEHFTTSLLRKLLFLTACFLPCQIQIDGILSCNRNTIISFWAKISSWLLHVWVNCSMFLFLITEQTCLTFGYLSWIWIQTQFLEVFSYSPGLCQGPPLVCVKWLMHIFYR